MWDGLAWPPDRCLVDVHLAHRPSGRGRLLQRMDREMDPRNNTQNANVHGGYEVTGWIVVGVIAGVLGGLVAWYSTVTVAAAGEVLVALAGFVGYENIVEVTRYQLGVGRCSGVLMTAQERLDCFGSVTNRGLAVVAFLISCAIAALITYGLVARRQTS